MSSETKNRKLMWTLMISPQVWKMADCSV